MRRAVLAGVLAATLIGQTLEAQAGARASKRTPRSLVFGIAGATVGAAAAGFYMSAKDEGVTPGMCSQNSCVITFSLGLGTLIGYTVGREFDQLHALRYRGHAALIPDNVSAPLAGEPMFLVTRDSLVVAGGPGGLQVFTSGASLRPVGIRAAGLRGISALDVVGSSGSLVVGSTSGFYVYPATTGPGTLLRDGAAAAVATAGDRVFLGIGSRIEVAPAGTDTTRRWPGIEAGGRVETLAWDTARGVLWAIIDSSLVSFQPDGDSLRRVGATLAGAGARRLAVTGDRVAVAGGEGGVRMFNAADPANPALRWHWTVARFVYDVSVFEQRLYVASGIDGVYVLDISGAEPVVIGLARELGFATALSANRQHTFVLDRSVNAVRRFPSNF